MNIGNLTSNMQNIGNLASNMNMDSLTSNLSNMQNKMQEMATLENLQDGFQVKFWRDYWDLLASVSHRVIHVII